MKRILVCVAAALAGAVLLFLPSRAQGRASTDTVFEGTSFQGDFQEALDQALQEADTHFGQQGADILYTWRLLRTSGLRGGIVFTNDLTVRISASP